MATREEIAFGYRMILGREPESEAVVRARLHLGLQQLRHGLITSDEGRHVLWQKNRDFNVLHSLAELYKAGVVSEQEIARFSTEFLVRTNANLGALGQLLDLGARNLPLLEAVAEEIAKHDEYAELSRITASIASALKAFACKDYQRFEDLLSGPEWAMVRNHRGALSAGRSVVLEFLKTLKPVPAVSPHLQVAYEIREFYRRISACCFVDELVEVAENLDRILVVASCDLRYFSGFAGLLAGEVAKQGGMFLFVVLTCGEADGAPARSAAVDFNAAFSGAAFASVQLHEKGAMHRSFHTVPRLLALALAVCELGRAAISVDVDALPGPNFLSDRRLDGEPSDVVLPVHPDEPPWGKIFAGYVRVRPSGAGAEFARVLARYLLEESDPSKSQWHIDQNALLAAYLSALKNPAARIVDIWRDFAEFVFIPDSPSFEKKRELMEREVRARSRPLGAARLIPNLAAEDL